MKNKQALETNDSLLIFHPWSEYRPGFSIDFMDSKPGFYKFSTG